MKLKLPSDIPPPFIAGTDLEDDYPETMFQLLAHFNVSVCADLHFLVLLALTIEERNTLWKHRTYESVRLCLSINSNAGSPVDARQLAGATLAHDFAMAFLPLNMLDKTHRLNQDEMLLMRTHIDSAASLIQRMKNWEDAGAMILAHHEKIDGTGYPNNLKAAEICSGAKILAIIDTFTAQGGDIMQGVSEMNRHVGTQFDAEWVEHFNAVVHRIYHKELSAALQ